MLRVKHHQVINSHQNIILLHELNPKRKKEDNYKQAEKCKFCNYMTKNVFLLKKHILTEHSTKEERKEKITYYCNLCDFGTFSKDTYDIHLNTNKHKRYNVN